MSPGFLWCTVSFQRKLARVLPPAWAVCRKNFCWAADGEIGAPDERWTVMSAESYWLERFSRKSVPEPKLSVRNLLASVLGFTDITRLHKWGRHKLTAKQKDDLEKKATLRLARMPVQYIVGEWDFLDMTLKMSPPVFIPRPETESLVMIASELSHDHRNCLEIGCGSGAISLGLARNNSKLRCIAVDTDPLAVSLSQTNARSLGLKNRCTFHNSTLLDAGLHPLPPSFPDHFDLVVSNPPYIPAHEVDLLPPEILQYESRLALDGGPGAGTQIIQLLVEHSLHFLRPSGKLVIEIDPRQVPFVGNLADKLPFQLNVHKDCFQVDRIVVLTKL